MNSIDAVISWVDGYDLDYQRKLSAFCLEQGIEQKIAVEPTRIQQCNEIYYCLHSLRRFAPWLRSIYIITDQQIPSVVNELQGSSFGDKIKIIDQNYLLNEVNVQSPAFNSITIEWLIWRIKGLSEQFLYLNDDFFLLRHLNPDDFFRNNQVVLRGEMKVAAEQKLSYRLKKYFYTLAGEELPQVKTNPHRAWQEKSAKLAGWDNHFYLLPHAPFPLIKKTFEQFVAQKPELFNENIRYAFRSANQISSVPLMSHLDIKNNRAIYDTKYHAIMVNGASHSFKKIKKRLQKAHKNPLIAFLCMQSVDQASLETQQFMLDWLQQHIIS